MHKAFFSLTKSSQDAQGPLIKYRFYLACVSLPWLAFVTHLIHCFYSDVFDHDKITILEIYKCKDRQADRQIDRQMQTGRASAK